MPTQETKQYTLETGAPLTTVKTLMKQIMKEHAPDDRVRLIYGTCALLCDDADEREDDKVTARQACRALQSTIEESLNMNITESTRIVKEMQDQYLRGEMSEDMQKRLLEINHRQSKSYFT
jgi:hypothetical protein